MTNQLVKILPAAALWMFATTTLSGAEKHVWILAGQSNMRGGQQVYAAAIEQLVKAEGYEFQAVFSSAPGKPIAAWLDPKHRDYDSLWTKSLEQGVKAARQSGGAVKGFVWYQGESDTDRPWNYVAQLRELVKRSRDLTAVRDLPVIIIQLAARVGYRPDRAWNTGLIRESERRFVAADKHAALVAAIDCEIGDYTVHVSRDGHAVIARRITAAAKHLAYGGPASGWGPQFQRAHFSGDDRRCVVIEYDSVDGQLVLAGGWQQSFSASRLQGPLPKSLDEEAAPEAMAALHMDFENPIAGDVLDSKRIGLRFERPLDDGAAISFAASANAQLGLHRRWGLELGGVVDGSGEQAPAFVLAPIEMGPNIDGLTDRLKPAAKPATYRPDRRYQIAVNCIGRYPPAVQPPAAEAGPGGWRQAYWNPASSHATTNLLDSRGRVGPVSFHTGVWYMLPYFRELGSADDALMASWCKHRVHGFAGLEPNARHDISVYLLQGPSREKNTPKHRRVRVTILHPDESGKRDRATTIAEGEIDVPASGRFDGYQLANEASRYTGNYVVFESVTSDALGRIDLAVETAIRKGDRLRWSETTLAGVQIRFLLGTRP